MAEPLTSFQEPGFFSQIQESPSLFLLPGSVRVVGIVGAGKATKSVLQESKTRVDTGTNHVESLASDAASIARVYSDSVFQYPSSSYSTSITGNVVEGAGYNVTGETLKVSVNDGATQTVTFTGANPISLANVVTQINAVLTGAKAEAASSKLRILSGDGITGDGGKKIKILDGTANVDLGFSDNEVCDEINWKASFASTDPNVRPLDGEKYFVDYETPKVLADLQPKSYFSLQQVSAAYGEPSVANSASLGAAAAFGNGASLVVIRQVDPNGTYSADIDAALTDMESQQIDVLVPMSPDTSLWPKYLSHVSKMSSKLERKERRAILGVDETTARIPITGLNSWTSLMAGFSPSSGLQPKRIQVMNPGSMLVTIKNSQFTVNGCYAAAALAGAMCSPAVDTATPMTYKALQGIDQLLLPDLLRSQKNVLTSLGVTVLEHRGAEVIVRRSVTADSSSIASQEPSVVFSLDQVAKEVREALEDRFVGSKIIPGTTKAALEAATTTFLLRFQAEEIIGSFRNVNALQNGVEPRQFDISVEVLPIFPFLWGTLDLTIVLS